MRIDLYLKTILFKRRNTIKIMCLRNLIRINGRPGKASIDIKPGDLIEIETIEGVRRLRVTRIPEKNIKKAEATLFYDEVQKTTRTPRPSS